MMNMSGSGSASMWQTNEDEAESRVRCHLAAASRQLDGVVRDDESAVDLMLS